MDIDKCRACRPIGTGSAMSDHFPALLPCPFCGGIPGIHERGNDHTRTRSVTIKCPACRCERTDAAMRNPMAWLREVAAENWNTRKGPAAKEE